jgi:deoxyribonuclease V
MKIRRLHSWRVTPQQAIEIQNELRSRIHLSRHGPIERIAGADVCYSKLSSRAWAGVVVVSYPKLETLEEKWIGDSAVFPYLSGLLGFREIPPLLKVLTSLETEPDLIFCDGHGIAHPRGVGLASHFGLLISKATLGCAKRPLVGTFSTLGRRRGEWSPLRYEARDVGAVVRTMTGVKPVFVSPGYGITIETAVRFVLDCGGRYRMPEPLRQAHLLVTGLRRRQEAS